MTDVAQTETVASVPAVAITPDDGESFEGYLGRFLESKRDAPAEPEEPAVDDASGETVATEPKEQAPEALSVDALKKLAKDGEYEKVLHALGVEPDGTKIPSSRFARFRKLQSKGKAELAAERAKIEARAREVSESVARVQADYAGFAKAKQAFDDGDIVGAIEAAFGEQLDVITDKAVKQKLATDPELVKLKRKLEAKEKAEQEAQRKAQEEAQRASSAAQRTQHIELVRGALKESSDELLGKLAAHKNFAEQVYSTMLSAYEKDGTELEPDEAAQKVLKVLRSEFEEWAPFLATSGAQSTEVTAGAGKTPSNTDRTGKVPEKQGRKGVSLTRATAAPAPQRTDLTDEEEWALLRDRAIRNK